MERGDRIVKLTTNFLYFLIGIIGTIIAIRHDIYSRPYMLIIYIVSWVAVFTFLSLLKTDTEKEVRTYVFFALFLFTFLSLYTALILNSPYNFVVCQYVYMLCNIPGIRNYVFIVLTILNSAVLFIMTFVLHMFIIPEFALILLSFLVACWIAFIFANIASKSQRMIVEQNQSYDDLINVIESRFIEEKGANTAKSTFLANMSHEIRTPINAILGLNTMTLRESNDPRILEYARDIENAGQTLLALVNDILDISKVESGKMEIVPVEYNLSNVISDVINMIAIKAKAKNLDIKVRVNENLPSVLFGDDVRIRQVLTNLLTNAVKYTEKGYILLNLGGELHGDYAVLRFSVTDTGIGIKSEDMEKLFAKFERLDTVKNRNVEGTGLGMAITQKLLELMNSKLEVQSSYGEGSTFSFELVQRIIDKSAIGDINKKFEDSQNETATELRYIAPDAKILVVDDNKTNRLVFKRLLMRVKVQIDEADGGLAALDCCNNTEYDAIFLDHMMPGMDGVEALHKMRENTVCPNINTPVIALTANALSGSRDFYLGEGFDDYMSKPIDPKLLERMLFEKLPRDKVEVFSKG